MITTETAIMSLRPNVEWSMNGDDVEGIIWHTEGAEPLTTAEVQAEIKRLEKAEADKIKADQAATAAAVAHAKSLGFTDEMIAVMYPNLAPSAP
jgi:predicted ATPase